MITFVLATLWLTGWLSTSVWAISRHRKITHTSYGSLAFLIGWGILFWPLYVLVLFFDWFAEKIWPRLRNSVSYHYYNYIFRSRK